MEKKEVRSRILVVDDEKKERELFVRLLEGKGYQTTAVPDGGSALEAVSAAPPDLILLDLRMPGIDGFEVTTRLKSAAATKSIPIIMVTGADDRESRIRAPECGVEEFLLKPIDRDELLPRVRNLLKLKQYGDLLAEHAKTSDRLVKNATIRLREAYRDITFTLTRAAEYRDEDTGAHVRRVANYTWEIASCLGLERTFLDEIFYAAPMHDVGKIGVPDSILLKAGSLTAEEWVLMRKHTEIGNNILAYGRTPFTKMGAEIALSHHERWDGTGYPKQLKGEEIPLSGRIMNICDQYDAMRSKRPYKPPFDHAKVMEILTKGDGRTMVSHFDPDVHGAFLRCSDRFAEIFDNLQDEE
ncbi:MAG: response regulator [Proteobacteria bacterium]|jgi:putative two-component system response regulator|nr:response regulator [Pseudomonadota bacterium]